MSVYRVIEPSCHQGSAKRPDFAGPFDAQGAQTMALASGSFGSTRTEQAPLKVRLAIPEDRDPTVA